MKREDLKDGLKPFFVFIVLFEVLYVILSILGYLIWIIADKIRMHKRYAKGPKGEEKSKVD